MTDDQTLESLRVMSRVKADIADQGVTFTNAVVSFPLCCPSRASFFTGQYGHNTGVMGNALPNGGYPKFTHPETAFPQALQDAGYRTTHIGKYLNGYREPAAEVPPGWTVWDGFLDPSTYSYHGMKMLTKDGTTTFGDGEDDYSTDVVGRLAVDAVEQGHREGKPFLLSVAFLAPHNEVAGGGDEGQIGAPVPAERHQGRFADEPLPDNPAYDEPDVADKPPAIRQLPRIRPKAAGEILTGYRARLESLLAVDEAVGAVVDELDQSGELERTVIVFTSDNGFHHGEHRIAEGKATPYEESIHVPLLIRGPGLPEGATRSGAVANIDLAPTFLELAKAKALRPVDGRSLVGPAQGADQDEDRGILLEMGGPLSRITGVRTARYAYWERPTGDRELYDLTADPHELDNKAGDPALQQVEAELAKRLGVLRDCAGADCAGDPT
jgi:arylsulfatase A-like enzyme